MRQIRQLQKSSLPVKSRYFLTTNQLFCFRFDIDKFIRMHTNIRIQRYTYIHAYMHEFIHKNKPPPIITSTTDKGENDIHSCIDSRYFYSASLSPLLLRGAPDHSIDSVGVYTTKHYRQPYSVYAVYNIYYILLVKDLPKVPGVAARMVFEPTTFRSKGIESTNVPPRPTNINR